MITKAKLLCAQHPDEYIIYSYDDNHKLMASTFRLEEQVNSRISLFSSIEILTLAENFSPCCSIEILETDDEKVTNSN